MCSSLRHSWPGLGPKGREAHAAKWTGPPTGRATDFGSCPVAGKQARATSVDLGLGPEPPVLFPRGPLPPITDYYHQQGYLKEVSWVWKQLPPSWHKVCSASPGYLCLPETCQIRLSFIYDKGRSIVHSIYIANSLRGESLLKYISLLELSSSFIAYFKTSWTSSFSTFGIYFGRSFLS